MCFLLRADQKCYSFLLKQLKDWDNVGRDEYPVTTTSALDLLICTEGCIHKNKQSTYDNCGGRTDRQQKGRTGNTFSQQLQRGTHGSTKENATLVPGRDRTNLNSTFYKCHKTGHLTYNFSEAGSTSTYSLQVIHSCAHIKINKMSWLKIIRYYWTLLHQQLGWKCIFSKNFRNWNAEDKLLMLKNGEYLSFNQMGELLSLPMTFPTN